MAMSSPTIHPMSSSCSLTTTCTQKPVSSPRALQCPCHACLASRPRFNRRLLHPPLHRLAHIRGTLSLPAVPYHGATPDEEQRVLVTPAPQRLARRSDLLERPGSRGPRSCLADS